MQTSVNSASLTNGIPAVSLPSIETLQARLDSLDKIPSVPTILLPLTRNLDQPVAAIDVRKITELISYDESIAAQCLRIANSPLFGRWQNVDSIHAAVMALGITRVRDIAMSCCLLSLLPQQCGCIDPRAFWEHSLAVAMVSRRLARRIEFKNTEKAYLAGLLHDVGIVANLLTFPDEFRETAKAALSQRLPLHEVEPEYLSFTHSVSGSFLADRWHLTADLNEVIRRHHDPEHATVYRSLTALVNIADLVCRKCGLGYGYNETKKPALLESPAWPILASECTAVNTFGAARFASEMDMYANEVRRLVGVLFRLDR